MDAHGGRLGFVAGVEDVHAQQLAGNGVVHD
jgi:hypothetical protein